MAGNTRHVVNMANSIVGVSILSMPYCFKEAGLLLGVVMVLISGVITKKTCMFLVRAAIMARHRSYEFLAFHVFGVRGKLAVELCMILFLIGICISFHVVMGDLAPAIAARLLHIHNTPSLRATMLLGIAILVVLPLCLLRKLDNLASMSACSILFYFFLITVIFWHAFPRLVDGSWFHLAHLWRPAGVLQVLPICMLGLSCQSNVFEIYDSVPDPDVPKMRAVVNNALNLCCALYIAVGFFGYIAFVDQDIAGNLIMNFPASPLTEGIKLFFTVSLAISFPLMIFPCRTSIHSLVYRRNTQGFDLVGNYMPEARFKAITVGILTVSVVVGILVPNIDFLPEGITKLQEWSKQWLLQFNEEECKVLHHGRGNPAYQYHMGNTPLSTTEAVNVTRLPVKARSVQIAADYSQFHFVCPLVNLDVAPAHYEFMIA